MRAATAGVLRPAKHSRLKEGPIEDQLRAALEQIEQANLAVRPLELVLFSTAIHGIRRRSAASASAFFI